MRRFVAAGAAILVPAATTAFFEKIFSARSSIEPDRLAKNPVTARVVGVPETNPFVLADATHPIRLLPVTNSHVRDMLMAHLPNDGLLFESDLLDAGQPFFLGAAMKTWATELRDALVANQLTSALIVAGHGGTATFAELEAAIAQ